MNDQQQTPIPTTSSGTVVSEKKKSSSGGKWVKRLLWVLVLVFIILTLRPLIHEYIIIARKFTGITLLIVAMVVGYIYFLRKSKKSMVFKSGLTIALLAISVGIYFLVRKHVNELVHHLYYNSLYQSLNKVELKDGQFPFTINSRIQPRDNMLTKGYETVQDNSDISPPHIAFNFRLNREVWSMSQLPSASAVYQRYFDNVTRIYSVPSDTTRFAMIDFKKTVNFFTTDHSHAWKNTSWNAILSLGWKYFYMEPGQVFYLEDEQGNPIQVTTLIKWTGFLIATPKFGGVIIERSGSLGIGERLLWPGFGLGEYYSPEDIQRTSFLKNQNLIDEEMCQQWALSFTYKEGLTDMVTERKNLIEIPSFAHENNKPPYVVPMTWDKTGLPIEKGLFDYIPLEAKGETRTGLALSLIIPSDGRDVVYVYDHAKREDGVFGITAVPGKIRDNRDDQAIILRDWSRSEVVEVIPCVIDIPGVKFPDNLFWKSVVLTKREAETGKSASTTHHGMKQFDGTTEPFVALCHARQSVVISVPAEKSKDWTNLVIQKMWPHLVPKTIAPSVDSIQVVMPPVTTPVVSTVQVDTPVTQTLSTTPSVQQPAKQNTEQKKPKIKRK